MKTHPKILYSAVLLVVFALSSCKKKDDPAPGETWTPLPFKQEGTTLHLNGRFGAADLAFDQLQELPFFADLSENKLVIENIDTETLRNESGLRTESTIRRFTITRRDSLKHSFLTFVVHSVDGTTPVLDQVQFNARINTPGNTYRQVYTSVSNQESALDGTYFTSNGNNYVISNWSYNEGTTELSFDYSALTAGEYNSTGQPLTFSGTVKATILINTTTFQ